MSKALTSEHLILFGLDVVFRNAKMDFSPTDTKDALREIIRTMKIVVDVMNYARPLHSISHAVYELEVFLWGLPGVTRRPIQKASREDYLAYIGFAYVRGRLLSAVEEGRTTVDKKDAGYIEHMFWEPEKLLAEYMKMPSSKTGPRIATRRFRRAIYVWSEHLLRWGISKDDCFRLARMQFDVEIP